jgi:hypothetical protein
MSEQKDERNEKEEKGEKDEKGRHVEHRERHEEKGEKYRRDPFLAIFVGLIIVLAAVLWFLRAEEILVVGAWWQWFLVGLGGIFILDRLIRYASPTHRRPMFSRILVGLILMAVGFGFIYGVETWWPLIVAIVGAAFIGYGIYRARKPKT